MLGHNAWAPRTNVITKMAFCKVRFVSGRLKRLKQRCAHTLQSYDMEAMKVVAMYSAVNHKGTRLDACMTWLVV